MDNSIKSSVWSFLTLLVLVMMMVAYSFAPNVVSGENLLLDFSFLGAGAFAMCMSARYAYLSSNEVREDE